MAGATALLHVGDIQWTVICANSRQFATEDSMNRICSIVGFVALWATLSAGASMTTTKHDNSIGTVQYQDNPLTYKAGMVSVSGLVDDAVVIRIQPLATYSLFTEDVLLCEGAKLEPMFAGKHNPLVLTYKTRASRLVQSLGCHDLIRVDEMKTTKNVDTGSEDK